MYIVLSLHLRIIEDGLRSYLNHDNPEKVNEIGLEETPEQYVARLVDVFREVRRVLRQDGTAWINLGDSYKDKQLLGIPWLVAFALQAEGYYLRQDLIWHKKNTMPSSVKDRCVTAHEYIFLLSKSSKYSFDHIAIQEPAKRERWGNQTVVKDQQGTAKWIKNKSKEEFSSKGKRNKRSVWQVNTGNYSGAHFATFPPDLIEPMILAGCPEKTCASCGKPYVRKEKIVGTQITEQMLACGANAEGQYTGQAIKDYSSAKVQNPSDTKRRILESMSKVREYSFEKSCSCETNETKPGIVLDPFVGSGTTMWVAKYLGRDSIGIELNKDYFPLIQERLLQPAPNKKEKKPPKKKKPVSNIKQGVLF